MQATAQHFQSDLSGSGSYVNIGSSSSSSSSSVRASLSLNGCFQYMRVAILQRKTLIQGSIHGLSAQLAMHFAMGNMEHAVAPNSGSVIEKVRTSPWNVWSHFALPVPVKADITITGSGLEVDQLPWTPSAAFPSPRHDALLYMLLGGPLMLGKREYSVVGAYEKIYQDIRSRGGVGMPESANPAALSRDGSLLEALGCAAAILASHRGGLAGINLGDFLLHLCNELRPNNLTKIAFNGNAIADLDLKVPYLSPPNCHWPDCLVAYVGDSIFVRNCTRRRNRDMYDAAFGDYITAEMKNHEQALSGGNIKKLIELMPAQSKCHILLVSAVSKRAAKDLADVVDCHVVLLRLKHHDGTPTLEHHVVNSTAAENSAKRVFVISIKDLHFDPQTMG